MLKKIFSSFIQYWHKISGNGGDDRQPIKDEPEKHDYYVHDNKRVYAIGDIHGCDVLLLKALDKMIDDAQNHRDKKLIFIGLGDYIDRGSHSKNVIEILLTKIPDYFEKIFLRGNHELYMLGFMSHPQKNVSWLDYGGIDALLSYGVKPPKLNQSDLKRASSELRTNMPISHLDFLQNLKNYHIIDDYFFVHAGIDPDIHLDKQSELILTSIRAKFINHTGTFQGKKIVHGHTPIENPDLQKHRINLDTGAYLTGNLTIGIFEKNMVTIL
jgi:serine/threonine protein phosphatase 1